MANPPTEYPVEYLDVVNEDDIVIDKAPKRQIYQKLLPHRIVHVLIFDNQDRMLLQLRSKECSFCPRHWSTSIGGHVRSGESYEDGALRELDEEIGDTLPLEFFSKDYYRDQKYNIGLNKFVVAFKARSNGPFKLDPKAVEKVEFFTLGEIQKLADKGDLFHPELLFLLKKYFGIR